MTYFASDNLHVLECQMIIFTLCGLGPSPVI